MKFLNFFLILFFSTPIFLSLAPNVYAIKLKWDIPKDERLEMVKTAKIEFRTNSRLKRVYEERNIIDLTCYKKEPNYSYVQGEFTVFRRESNEPVFLRKENDFSDFKIDPFGHFIVDKKYIMPNLRHVPTFPDKDIKVGDKWNAPLELLLNNFSITLNMQLNAEYKLSSVRKKDNKEIAIIEYKYLIDKNLMKKRIPRDLPKRIKGQNVGVIYWDLKQNSPISSIDRYQIIFLFANRQIGFQTMEFRMNIESDYKIYPPITEIQKEKDKKEIEKEMKDTGISVDTNDKGIVLRMGEVLFDFNSYALKLDTQATLDKVIDIIKRKYPDREIIVEGHTDSVGNPKYNQKLSENRAKSVSGYLKKGIGHDKFSYKGHGEQKPIANNKTDLGRQKNRRVEITIKLK